MKNSCR